MVSQEIDLINDTDQDWVDNCSEPDTEVEPEVEHMHENELTNLRVLEWHYNLPADPKETLLAIQVVDQISVYISHDNTESNWVAPDSLLRGPEFNHDLIDSGRLTCTSMDNFVRGVG